VRHSKRGRREKEGDGTGGKSEGENKLREGKKLGWVDVESESHVQI
jgi:hypothetical protein